MINYYGLLPKSQFDILTQTSPNDQSIKKQHHQHTKKYSVISDEKRNNLIQLILNEGVSVKKASQDCDIKLSTAKAILKTYKTQGRIGKKKQRQKRLKKEKQCIQKHEDFGEQIRRRLPKVGQNYIYYPYLPFYPQQCIKEEEQIIIKEEKK